VQYREQPQSVVQKFSMPDKHQAAACQSRGRHTTRNLGLLEEQYFVPDGRQ
jgi:hypothetical protein